MEDGFEVVNLHGCASGVIPTPTIGTNGNWFVGNKDTEVCAKGADGATGEQGIQGLKGDQGEIGSAGPQGIQGIQGEKGIQGDKGEQGIKGDKGDQGEKGTDADTAELERLSKEVDALDNSMKEVSTEMESTKKSVADGKALVASAITEKGVATVAGATFQTMATNIRTMAVAQYNNGYSTGKSGSYYVSTVSGSWGVSSGVGYTQNSTSASIGITGVCSNYTSVNAGMCIFEITNANVNVNGTLGIGTSISKSYNASNGVLTVTLNYQGTNAMVRSVSGRVLVYWTN